MDKPKNATAPPMTETERLWAKKTYPLMIKYWMGEIDTTKLWALINYETRLWMSRNPFPTEKHPINTI